MEEDSISLGGNINLSGFRSLDKGSMLIVRKMVGNYCRKFSDRSAAFEQVSVTMKSIHERENSRMYEVHAKLIDNGKVYASEVTERNIFIALDNALKKVEKSNALQ